MLNAGVIGVGKMGISHCSILGAHPDIDMVSICDNSSLVLSALKQYSKFNCYNDYRKMLDKEKLDFVIVASPTKLHYPMVHLVLDHNYHVFCEKPLTLNVKDSKSVTSLVLEKKLINQVGYHNRFIGTFQKVKQIIYDGLVGEVYHINGKAFGPVIIKKASETWRTNPSEGGGCLSDYASHIINLIQYVLDSPQKVSGTILKNIYSNKVEDAVYSSLFFKNGITGQLSVNWSEETYRKMSTSLEVLGKKGKVMADSQECQLYLKEDPGIQGYQKGWNSFWITDQTKPVLFNLRGEEYTAQIDYFIEKVKNQNFENINSFSEALKTDELIEMLRNDVEVS